MDDVFEEIGQKYGFDVMYNCIDSVWALTREEGYISFSSRDVIKAD